LETTLRRRPPSQAGYPVFVWADSQDADYAPSYGGNFVAFRCRGGVHFEAAAAAAAILSISPISQLDSRPMQLNFSSDPATQGQVAKKWIRGGFGEVSAFQ